MGFFGFCKTPRKHKRMLLACYPAKDYEKGKMNTGALGKLKQFAMANPEKLPQIGKTLEKQLSHQIRKQRIKRVSSLAAPSLPLPRATRIAPGHFHSARRLPPD